MAKLDHSLTKYHEIAGNMFIWINFPEPSPSRGQLIFTTEENSYGIEKRMWFDGEVEVVDWERGEDISLTIVDITEYHYMGSTCSKESFYECLANRISSMSMEDVKSYDPFCHVDANTSFCLPFSLPSKIPICNKTEPGFSFLDCKRLLWTPAIKI